MTFGATATPIKYDLLSLHRLILIKGLGLYDNFHEDANGCIIHKNKILRPSQYRIFENWYEWLREFFQFKEHYLLAYDFQKVYLTTDDEDMLADGIIAFVNPNGQQTSVMIPFQIEYHEKLREALSGIVTINGENPPYGLMYKYVKNPKS